MATQRDKRSSHFQGQTLRRLKQSEENIISLKKDIQMLKTQVRKRPSTEQKLQEEIIILKNQNQDDLLNKIQNTKTYIAQLKQYTQNLKTDFSENRQAVIEAFQKLKEQLIIELSKIKVDNENEFAYMNNFSHPFSPHKFHYRAIKSGADIIATRTDVDNTSYRNFIHTLQVGNGDAINFTVKINRLTSNALLLGVGTQQVFNKLDPFCEDSCFYSANVGGIWNGSAFIDGKSKSEAGDQLQLLIDRKKNQLFWKRNGQKLEQIKLPNIFENKPSFLIIKLAHYEDSITVSAKKL